MQHVTPDRFADTAGMPGADWTLAECELLTRLWRAGRPLLEIAAALRRSPEAVRSRARRLKLAPRRLRRAGAAAGRLRPCLCCGARFRSEGPHHRLCEVCRQAGGPDFRVAL
jgi:hypothetical protein